MNKIFIWDRAENTTECYHNEAAVVIIALTVGQARALLRNNIGNNLKESSEVFTKSPDHIVEITDHKYFVFPDAGCC